MKTKLYLLLLFAAVGLNSCTKPDIENQNNQDHTLIQKPNPVSVPAGDPLTRRQLDQIVIGTLESRNDFQWEMIDLKTLWSALQYNDHSLAIGYKPATEGDISGKIHQLQIQTGEYKKVHDALIGYIISELNKSTGQNVSLQEILVEDDPVLPVITIRLTDKNVLTSLYNLENVRYLEPLDYTPEVATRIESNEGCSASSTSVNSGDWTTISPNAKMPWNYTVHNISGAWNLSHGYGITIGVIDAGISSSQTLLGSGFNDGESNVGRVITTGYTYGSGAYTSCYHGTAMSGLAAGPRNAQSATCGVAYESNLSFIRGCNDVVLDGSSERTGVKNACVQLGNNTSVKIISMSIGTPFSSSVLKDGVDYAYGRGKLIMAAAGTSFSWTSWVGVIYPAKYSSCVAVTGVKENGSKCSSCHSGSQVVYTITMERNSSSNRNSLSLPYSGTSPKYIGGSSAATSTSAGIAALVWAARPGMSRSDVLNCLTRTSQYYPNKSGSTGYGNLNAEAAVNYALTHY